MSETIETPNVPTAVAKRGEAVGEVALAIRLRQLIGRLSLFSTIGSSFAVFGLQAAHAVLLARLLGPEGRGEYGTAVFFAQTLLYTGLAGTLYSIARSASNICSSRTRIDGVPEQTNEGVFGPLQRAAVRVGLITGSVSMLVAMGLSIFALPEDKSYLLPLCLVCALMLPAEHVRLTALAVDHGRGTFNRYNLARLTGAAIFPCLLIPLYLLEISNLWLIAAITVIVPIVGYAFYWKTSDTRSLRGSAVPAPLQLIREGRADGLAVLSGDLFDRLGLLLILWMVSLEDQGHYLTAVPAASMLLVAPHAFALFSFKLAADHQQPLRVSNGLRLGALVIAVQALSWLALSYVLQPLLLLLYGEPFRAALPVTGILLSAMAINGCGIVGDGYLRGRGRASVGVWTRIAGALVMLVAVWYYHAWPPLLRVAMATTVGTAAIALITGWVIIRDLIAREKSVAA